MLILSNDTHSQIDAILNADGWIVACLCAAWCDSCKEYAENFTALAKSHPDIQFVWIDIEDQSELLGDHEIENFPTLLIQRGDIVAFLGPIGKDTRLAKKILLAQMAKTTEELRAQATHRHWEPQILRQNTSSNKSS